MNIWMVFFLGFLVGGITGSIAAAWTIARRQLAAYADAETIRRAEKRP